MHSPAGSPAVPEPPRRPGVEQVGVVARQQRRSGPAPRRSPGRARPRAGAAPACRTRDRAYAGSALCGSRHGSSPSSAQAAGRRPRQRRGAAAAGDPVRTAIPASDGHRTAGQPEQHGLGLVVQGVPEQHGRPARRSASAAQRRVAGLPGRRLGTLPESLDLNGLDGDVGDPETGQLGRGLLGDLAGAGLQTVVDHDRRHGSRRRAADARRCDGQGQRVGAAGAGHEQPPIGLASGGTDRLDHGQGRRTERAPRHGRARGQPVRPAPLPGASAPARAADRRSRPWSAASPARSRPG